MGVSIYYSGRLAEGKTIEEVVSYVEEVARKEGFRCQRPEEFSNRESFTFDIPKKVMDNPDLTHWSYPNSVRIQKYAVEARIPTKERSHRELCQDLNSREFKQTGVYLWICEKAEPLRFLFVEGDTELTEISQDWLGGGRGEEDIKYVSFRRESLSTKTAYEHDIKHHIKAKKVLQKVNKLFFNGKMVIRDPN